ncbi:hypothetical protein YC2023_016705 [Brassica napus]
MKTSYCIHLRQEIRPIEMKHSSTSFTIVIFATTSSSSLRSRRNRSPSTQSIPSFTLINQFRLDDFVSAPSLSAGKCSVAFHFNDVSPGPAESELRFWLIQLWDGSLEPGEGGGASVTASDGKTEKDVSFTKLDELFTQTQLYSEFLLEKMEDITKNGTEGETQKAEPEKKGGRGRKRKAATQMKAKKVVAAMLYSIDCRMKI